MIIRKDTSLFNHFAWMAKHDFDEKARQLGENVVKACQLFEALEHMTKQQVLQEKRQRNMKMNYQMWNKMGHVSSIIHNDFSEEVSNIVDRIYSW